MPFLIWQWHFWRKVNQSKELILEKNNVPVFFFFGRLDLLPGARKQWSVVRNCVSCHKCSFQQQPGHNPMMVDNQIEIQDYFQPSRPGPGAPFGPRDSRENFWHSCNSILRSTCLFFCFDGLYSGLEFFLDGVLPFLRE